VLINALRSVRANEMSKRCDWSRLDQLEDHAEDTRAFEG